MAFVLTLAFVQGCATVISKMINFRCTKYLGTNNGSLVNYVVATVLSFVLLVVSSRFHVDSDRSGPPCLPYGRSSYCHGW